MYKRTTRSGPGGRRTTYTTSRSGSKQSSKITTSLGSKYSRVSTTTNLNTGERKTYLTQRTADGWISRKSLSAPKTRTSKPKKPRSYRSRRSKPVKLKTIFWVIIAFIIIGSVL